VPVLVLSGDLDANTPTASARAAAAQFRHARVIEVPGAGHTPVQMPEGLGLALEFLVSPR
jgi:pimeloyl-ACP methyl ester carboxylesterase